MLQTGKMLSFTLFAVFCVFILGCGAGKKGKFSQEEMELLRYPTRSGLPQASGGYTINVGDNSLSTEEVISAGAKQLSRSAQAAGDYEQFKTDSTPVVKTLVTRKIADLLLFQEAQKSMPDNFDEEMLEKAVEDEVRRFIASHGGNYSLADKAVKEMGMDWESFREYQKRMLIVQSYLASETSETEPVTYDDILNYYNAQKDKRFTSKPSYQFRLIDIQVDEIDISKPNDPNQSPPTAKEAAMQRANEIVRKLNAGEDFEQLAKAYSHGFAAEDGGLWQPVTRGSLAAPYEIIETYIDDMEKYEIAGPIESNGHFFVFQLEFKTDGGVVPFTKVQQRLAGELEFMRRKQMIDKMMTKFSGQVDMGSLDDFINSCLRQAYNKFN